MIASAARAAYPFALLPVLILPLPVAVLVLATCAVVTVAGLVVHEMRVEDRGPRRVRRRLHQTR